MRTRALRATLVVATASLAATLAACGGDSDDDGGADAATGASTPAELQDVAVQLNFVPNVEHFGVTAAAEEELDEAQGVDVEVLPGGQGVDPVQVVGAGRADIGITSAEQFLLARSKGVPIVAVAAQFQDSPVALTCRQDRGVTAVGQIAGRTVGLKAPAEALFKVFLAVNRIDPGAVETKPIGASDVATIIAGAVDCQFTTFAVNEPNTMRKEGVEPQVFLLSENGLPAQSNVYFTSEATLGAKRSAIEGWLRATNEAWTRFMGDPEGSARWVVEGGLVDGLDLGQQTQQANGMVELMDEGPGLLQLDPSVWERTQANMIDSGQLTGGVDLPAVLDTTVLTQALAGP